MKHRLAGHIAYLAGPMDRVEDRGVEWRIDIEQFLQGMDIGVLNPCNKPLDWGVEDEDARMWRKESILKAEKLWNNGHLHESHKICKAIHEQMRDIVGSDLRCVDHCHFVILHVDLAVHSCGSYNEQTHACLQRKPVIVHCKQGKHHVPDWLWGICQHEMFFSTWDHVKQYIEHMAYDEKVEHLKRWRFFDMNKIYGREIF